MFERLWTKGFYASHGVVSLVALRLNFDECFGEKIRRYGFGEMSRRVWPEK